MSTLSNRAVHVRSGRLLDTCCRRAKWCDESDRHVGLCRRYLGEVRAAAPDGPAYVGVALVGTGRRDRRLELSGGSGCLRLDWGQVEYLTTLLVLAHKSYAS